MKKSRFSDEEKIGILKEVRAGATVVATCAKHNIGVQTYHGWKRKFGGMEVDEARRLRGLGYLTPQEFAQGASKFRLLPASFRPNLRRSTK